MLPLVTRLTSLLLGLFVSLGEMNPKGSVPFLGDRHPRNRCSLGPPPCGLAHEEKLADIVPISAPLDGLLKHELTILALGREEPIIAMTSPAFGFDVHIGELELREQAFNVSVLVVAGYAFRPPSGGRSLVGRIRGTQSLAEATAQNQPHLSAHRNTLMVVSKALVRLPRKPLYDHFILSPLLNLLALITDDVREKDHVSTSMT
mmetsp:Transcript_16038/g.37904  ORF Transcript_16038/g.37904 Transcript_16038/m.37904 type:complete len:204 (+) Transcript_16038:5344-5955(+)